MGNLGACERGAVVDCAVTREPGSQWTDVCEVVVKEDGSCRLESQTGEFNKARAITRWARAAGISRYQTQNSRKADWGITSGERQ